MGGVINNMVRDDKVVKNPIEIRIWNIIVIV